MQLYHHLGMSNTFPETNSKFTPENGCLGDEFISFWGCLAYVFFGANCWGVKLDTFPPGQLIYFLVFLLKEAFIRKKHGLVQTRGQRVFFCFPKMGGSLIFFWQCGSS